MDSSVGGKSGEGFKDSIPSSLQSFYELNWFVSEETLVLNPMIAQTSFRNQDSQEEPDFFCSQIEKVFEFQNMLADSGGSLVWFLDEIQAPFCENNGCIRDWFKDDPQKETSTGRQRVCQNWDPQPTW